MHVPLQEGHEGTGEVVLTLDKDFAEYIMELELSGELNKTVLVVTSDHGSHMGPYYMSGGMGEFEQKLPLLTMVFPTWFLDKYPQFRQELLANEQQLVSHYDTHWTFRHLSTLPEFGGTAENHDLEANSYVDVWDCARNRDYMEVIYQFQGKAFTRGIPLDLSQLVVDNIKQCFILLKYKPRTLQRAGVDMSEIAEEVEGGKLLFVEDVITDKLAYYWFLDAAKDLQLRFLLSEEIFMLQNQTHLTTDPIKESQSWNTLRAPGTGRFLFGRSLLKYHEDRDCAQAGIPVCVCSTPPGKQLRGSEEA